ncbi:uncharacterized zinc finger CCHC domain-containing protein At4g19190 [Impatiens glandulifera]|uniref:uncharacterized zinc finger CCHC domain-containing protein At4g19190 n=1 Tax=Impatiens glandulifera TaxID=253017 RepID=UPI001FB17247|nr:uncharacterized zinc finger CCHC domain-containing protein At4g19190 [Impatiens glandulifera]
MDEEEGGIRLSKRFPDKGGEVDNKTKSGTAWSHNFLNQKPWHPLSYRNQRRLWIAEQTDANHQRRADEAAREYSQEQEFFRQTALVSKKEKEKLETMKAVSFMYIRPPGYNPESAKAAEVADEMKKQEMDKPQQDGAELNEAQLDAASTKDQQGDARAKKKRVPRDVFGRAVPTEEQFEVLKNAPRMETGAPARVNPFGVEVRNVRCLRCGNFGHQSGDRECPLKDVITPNEESRLKRDDPLTAIQSHTDLNEPLKWELKQKPGMSPPRGGFNVDDPNQQIVAEDIFDEYGGFLGGDVMANLLTDLSDKKKKKKSKSSSDKKHKRKSRTSPERKESSSSDEEEDDKGKRRSRKMKPSKKKHHYKTSSSESESKHSKRKRHRHTYRSSSEEDLERHRSSSSRHHRHFSRYRSG